MALLMLLVIVAPLLLVLVIALMAGRVVWGEETLGPGRSLKSTNVSGDRPAAALSLTYSSHRFDRVPSGIGAIAGAFFFSLRNPDHIFPM
jgi:hypothetical protein